MDNGAGTILVDPETAAVQDIHPSTDAGRVAEVLEADGLRATLMERMLAKFRELGKAEDSLSKGLIADCVQSLANVFGLPEGNRPKYAKVADLILSAMGRDVRAVSQVRLQDETLENRTAKVNGYKQYATPFIALARWECGLFTKPELKHFERNPDAVRQITYDNTVFASPLEGLRGGVPVTTCYRLFRNVIAPSYMDLSVLDTTKTIAVGKASAKKHKVTMMVTDDDGRQKRGTVKVTEVASLTVGTIIGLLEAWKKPVTQSMYDQITAAMVYIAPKQA